MDKMGKNDARMFFSVDTRRGVRREDFPRDPPWSGNAGSIAASSPVPGSGFRPVRDVRLGRVPYGKDGASEGRMKGLVRLFPYSVSGCIGTAPR
jgi:hypothetical protein